MKNNGVIIVNNNITTNKEPDFSQSSKRPYSNALILFFTILQVLSFDYGFFKICSRKGEAIKFISMLIAIIMTMVLGYYSIVKPDVPSSNVWYFLLGVQYMLIALRLFFNNNDNSFCMFLKSLSVVDCEMNCIKKYYTGCKIIGFCLPFVIYKSFVASTHCIVFPNDCLDTCTTSIIRIIGPSLEIHVILYCLSFHLVKCRVKSLKDIIKDSNEPATGHILYKSLVDILEKCKKCFDILYVGSILGRVPDILMTTFTIVIQAKFQQEGSFAAIVVYSNWVLQYLIIVIAPAVIASQLAREVDKIKIILHDKLLLENGIGSKADAIKNFLLYIEARPMKFTICSIIPLNSSFPFLIIDIFATYLIVAVQFSHIY